MAKIGIAQFKPIPGSPGENAKRIRQIIKEMKTEGVELGIFPEMSVPGYLIGDKWENKEFVLDSIKCMDEIRKETGDGFAAAVGDLDLDYAMLPNDKELSDISLDEIEDLIKRNPHLRYRTTSNGIGFRKHNSVWVMQDGKYAQRIGEIPKDLNDIPLLNEGRQPKVLDPNYREFDDKRHFTMLKDHANDTGGKIEDMLLPFAIKFKEGVRNIGFLTCEDMWFKDYFYNGKNLNPSKILVQNGAELLVNLSTSPFSWMKNQARHRMLKMVREDIIKDGKEMPPFVYTNCTGIQNNGKSVFIMDGRSTVYGTDGEPKIELPAFEEVVASVDIDLEKKVAKAIKIWTPGNKPVDVSHDESLMFPKENMEIKEIADSLIYMSENFFHKRPIFVGLSGGIDSAVVAALLTAAGHSVISVNMPTRENKAKTKNFAKQVADNLKIPYVIVDVDKNFQMIMNQIINTEIDGKKPDMSSENYKRLYETVQPKVRFIDILSNMASAWKGYYTCNSNKTEIFFGYETMDGGLKGAAAPIADLYKYQVRALAKYLNEEVFGREVIPEAMIYQRPSAELSESQNIEKGKGDPMIYEYHDFIARRAIEYREGPYQILKAFKEGWLAEKLGIEEKIILDNFKTAKDFIKDLEWAFSSFNDSFFKRVQAPPIFVVSKRGFGFDLREAIMKDYYSQDYQKLKAELLSVSR